MDPDQIADAGVQHQHDDLGGSATSADGCCDGGSGGGSWARALLRRGWDLSRKAAIAGVVASAAPVVAPQLLVLSLAGVALSLPFAAYLATLAATDRLMGALLPAPRTQPFHTCDLEDDEFLGASEAPGGEAPVFDHCSDTENDAIMEEKESFESLPLSREPRFSDEPMPSSTDMEGKMAEGEFLSLELGHESQEGTTMEDIEFITMEAPPRGSDVSDNELRDEDNMVERGVEAPLAAKESVQELSVSDNEEGTEDGKCKDIEEMESSKEILSQGADITELGDLSVPVSGDEGIVVQRGDGEKISVPKSGQDSHLTDTEDKIDGNKTKEEIPLQEANVSESSVLDDTMLERKIEGDVTVEMVTISTDPVTGEVAGEQVDSVTTALPERESLQASNLVAEAVAQELQAMLEVAYVDDVIDAALTEDVVLNIGDTITEGMEHNGEGGVSSFVSVATMDDVVEIVSSRSTALSGISDDMKSFKSRPDADRSQTTGYTPRNEEFREKEVTEDKHVQTEENKTMDDKLPTRSMSPQIIDVSKPPVLDDQSKIEDVTVEMVLARVASENEDLVTREVVAAQLNIIARESESPSVSGHVAQELQTVSESAVADEIQGSTVMEDIKNGFSDRTTEGVEHHSDRGTCSFVSTVDDDKDLVSSRSTPHASAHDNASSVEGTPVFDNTHQTTGVEYKAVNKGLRGDVVAEDMDNYTEEQLREQLDTLRTITGYRPAQSLTLEAELVGLYIFVGVEPPVSSRDASDLNDLNTKLRFLKSIIGVE